MKTSMQELIDWTYELENSVASLTYSAEDFRLIKQLREKFTSLLDKERYQLEKAFDIARNLPLNEAGRTNGSKFYKKTYGGKQ